jgi:hypothetical protein
MSTEVVQNLVDSLARDAINGEFNGNDVSIEGMEAELSELVNDPKSEMRAGRKIKRTRSSHSESELNGGDVIGVKPDHPAPFTKNSRKSRDGRGRGLPKKGLSEDILKCTRVCIYSRVRHVSFAAFGGLISSRTSPQWTYFVTHRCTHGECLSASWRRHLCLQTRALQKNLCIRMLLRNS